MSSVRAPIILALLSSVAVLAVLSKPVMAQGADHAVTLDTLSVDGVAGRPSASGADAGGPVGPVRGYTATRSVVGTKTDTPILETAQSISVISRKQIEDQNALTVTQALRYTPSVTTEQRGGSGSTRLEQFLIRGFTAPLFLDGMRLPSSRDAGPSVDPFRLERVDIIKGPASVLYGQSGPGGIVNLVSKVPSLRPPRRNLHSGRGLQHRARRRGCRRPDRGPRRAGRPVRLPHHRGGLERRRPGQDHLDRAQLHQPQRDVAPVPPTPR